jgi:hypothetical protein
MSFIGEWVEGGEVGLTFDGGVVGWRSVGRGLDGIDVFGDLGIFAFSHSIDVPSGVLDYFTGYRTALIRCLGHVKKSRSQSMRWRCSRRISNRA